MSTKKNSRTKYMSNRRMMSLYLAVGLSIIVIIVMSYMVCKHFGRVVNLRNDVVYVGLRKASSTERYYLQLQKDDTYVLMYENILGDDFAGQEGPPFISYSYGTYEKKGETYNLTPERAVEITFADKESVKKKKVSYYGYVEKEEIYGYWINVDVYPHDENNHYYLGVEKGDTWKDWLYKSKRTDLPATMEEFLAQYTFKKQ